MTAEANNMLYELLMHDPKAKANGHGLGGTTLGSAFKARFKVSMKTAFGIGVNARLASIEAKLDSRLAFRTQYGEPFFVLASAIRKATKSKSLVVSASGSSPSAKVKRANDQLFAQLAASSNPTQFIDAPTLGGEFKQLYNETLRQAFGGSFVSLLDERFETRPGKGGNPDIRIKPGMVAREQVQETTVEVKGVPVVYSSSAADAEEVLFGERSDGAKVSTVMVDFERDTNDDTVLVQIYVGSTGGPKCYIFDTQRSPHRFFGEGGPIRKLLASTNTFKVIHDCRADIRSLSSRHGVNKVRSIVDTQVLFADLDPSVPEPGFNTILKTLKLKSHELKESMDHRRWGDRPLSRKQLEYAALDVILLAKAFRKLHGDFQDRWPSVIKASTERAQSNIRKPKPPTAAAPAPSSADSADTDAKHGSPAGKPEFLAFLKNWEPTRHATWPECEADIEASRGGAAMSLPPLDSIQAQEEHSLLAVLPERVSQALRSYDESGRFSLSNLVDVSMDVGELPEALFSVPELLMDEGDGDAADDPLANPSEDLFTASDTAETWKSYPVALHEAGVLTQEDIESVLQHDMTTKVDPTTARAGISGTLHRVGVIFDSENAVGLTVRMGRAIMDPGNALADLLRDGKSALLIGRPGMGKTTMLRGIARMLADAPLNKRVIVVDTSGEIAGQGRTKHPCIGRARRIPVNRKEDQAKLLDQAVINHTPACMIIDEISTSKEVRSVRGIAQRGVQMIASVHGSTLADVVSNPDTCDLVGGAKTIIWGDQEMRARGRKSKVERQREKKPAFDVCVEVHGRGQWVVHANVKHAVDCILAGDSFVAERRRLLRDAERHVYTVEDHALYPVVTQPVVQHFLGSSEA